MPVFARSLIASPGPGFSWKLTTLCCGSSSTTPYCEGSVTRERDRGEGSTVLVKADHFSHVYIGEGVAHDDHEGLVEAVGEALYTAGCARQFLLAGKVTAMPSTRASSP